jgi:hypothetical protein
VSGHSSCEAMICDRRFFGRTDAPQHGGIRPKFGLPMGVRLGARATTSFVLIVERWRYAGVGVSNTCVSFGLITERLRMAKRPTKECKRRQNAEATHTAKHAHAGCRFETRADARGGLSKG